MQPFIPERMPHKGCDYAKPIPIRDVGAANRALARYDAILENSPIADLLLEIFVMCEAFFSSRIEGSRATLRESFQFREDENLVESGEQRDALNEIKNYANALGKVAKEKRIPRLSLKKMKSLHGALLKNSHRGGLKNPGNFRLQQVWIGNPEQEIKYARFVPPEPLLIVEFMENWEIFCRSEQMDVLIQAAVLHAQFELIHPFENNNGRIGRMMLPLFLYDKRATARPNFYLSAYLSNNQDAYMNALRGVSTKPGHWHDWIEFFIWAITQQAQEAVGKINRIAALYEKLNKKCRSITSSQYAIPLLDAVFTSPICRIATIKDKLAARKLTPSVQTLHEILTRLAKQKVLKAQEEGKGRRGTVYILSDLMRLLEEYE